MIVPIQIFSRFTVIMNLNYPLSWTVLEYMKQDS